METLRYTAHIDLQLLKPIASKSFSQMEQHVLSRQERKKKLKNTSYQFYKRRSLVQELTAYSHGQT